MILKKLVFSIIFMMVSCSLFAGEYVREEGKIERLELATYWSGHACVLLNGVWFHFKYDDGGSNFIKSAILASKMSESKIMIGSNTDNKDSVCGSLESYALLVFKLL